MAIICQRETILLAFQNSETLLAWVLTVRKQLGEEHQFDVEVIKAPPLSRLFQVHYTLYIQGTSLCLISGLPPKIHASWLLCDIKKFGIIENKFCFEAGKRCEKLAGLYVLLSEKLNDIYQILQAASAKSRPSLEQGSQNSLFGSRNVVSELQSASLARGSHQRERSDGYIPERSPVSGLVRCATVSEADCQRPSGRVRLEDIAQSTPNIQHKSLQVAKDTNCLTIHESDVQTTTDSSKKNSKVVLASPSCDNYCDSLKSRRYSSGDIYFSRARHHWRSSQRSQATAFGATAAALQQLQDSSQAHSESQRSHSQVDVSDFYIKVQRTLDVLSPKLGKPGDWKGVTVQSTDSVQTGSSSCGLDLESHGQSSQGYTSNSSLNLSEVLQSCSLFSSEDKLSEAVSDTAADLKYLKSLSSGSSCTSTRELFDTPTVSCSIGSLADVRSQQQIRCRHLRHAANQDRQRNCRCRLSNSIANLAALSSSATSTKDNPVVPHSFSWTKLNRCLSDVSLGGDVKHMPAMHRDNEICSIPVGNRVNASSKHAQHTNNNGNSHHGDGIHNTPELNPLQPLRYVDLRPYDGIDDGYIYCLKQDTGVTGNGHIKHVEYQNVPMGKQKTSCLRKQGHKNMLPDKNGTNINVTKGGLSIHGSLRRPQHKGTLKTYLGWDKRELEQIDNKLAGEYVCLKEDMAGSFVPPRPARMPKSSSLENISERDLSLANPSRYIYDAKVNQNKPGCDLSAVVPAHLAGYSKADLLEVLSKSAHTTSNKLTESLEKHSNAVRNHDLGTLGGSIKEPEYIMMGSSKALIDDNAVFCTVELPLRASDSHNTNGDISTKSRGDSQSKNDSATLSEDKGYLDMSLGRTPKRQPSKQQLRNVLIEPGYVNGPSSSNSHGKVVRSMRHSKSVEDELDVPYIDMKTKHWQSSAEYLVMSPSKSNQCVQNTESVNQANSEQADSSDGVRRCSMKPFDDLIQHKSYTEHKCKDTIETGSLGSSSKIAENSSIHGEKSSSEDDTGSQKSGRSGKKSRSSTKTSGKSAGLFSRLIKRNSIRNKEKAEKGKNDREKCKLKQSHSVQEFRSPTPGQKDKRDSMQSSGQSGIPIPTQSSSYSNDLAGSVESDSASQSSRSMASSHRSDSPAESGLTSLEWKLGGGVNVPAAQHNALCREISRSASFRVSQHAVHEQYSSSCPLDVVQSQVPPALPPKTFKRLRPNKGRLPNTAEPLVRRHSSEDQASAAGNASCLEVSPPRQGNNYANSCMFEAQRDTKQHNAEETCNVGNNLYLEDKPPPLPEKMLKGSKKSLVTIAVISTMETVPEGSNSAEKDNDSLEKTSLCGVDTDDDDVFLDEGSDTLQKPARNPSVLPPGESTGRRRKKPNLTVAIPGTSTEHGGYNGGRTYEFRHDGNISDNRLPSDQRSPGVSTDDQHARHLKTGTRLSTGSVSSCDSCDLHSLYSKEANHVSSPAITTMRPRFGKEYKRIDRKKLAEELNMPPPRQSSVSHSTEPSPSTAAMFTFECIPAGNLRSPQSSTYSGVGDTSPKYSQGVTTTPRHIRDPAYVNLSFSQNSSSVILDSTPPLQSPGAHSILSENSEVLLNYAEIDLSKSGKGKKPIRPLPKKGGVEYAVIDMVATAAASRVGREHAQLRENKLLQMNRDAAANHAQYGSTHSRGSSVTLPTPSKDKRTTLGRSNSTSSRDKRF